MSKNTLSTRKRIGVAALGSIASLGAVGTAGAQAASAATTSGASSSSVLAAIKYCESGGSYTVVNSIGAGGAYQFMPATWRGLGYSGLPQNASPATQDAAAQKLYAQQGTSPWVSSQSCWASKVGTIKSTTNSNTAASTSTSTSAVASSTPSESVKTSSSVTSNTNSNVSASNANEAHGDLTKHADVKLSDAETKAIADITASQKQQPTWTRQAASGKTIHRFSVQAEGLTTYTHTEADFASAQKDVVKDDEELVGHYVNTDWFEITSGTHAGQFVSTATLVRHGADVKQHDNGSLPDSALAVLPAWLSTDGDQLNPLVAKQLILMNAAFRADTGSNLSITQGYRAIAEQYHLRSTLGEAMTATPGQSNHGLGEAIDFATTFNPSTAAGLANLTWMKNNAALFGFAHPSTINSIETWHYDFEG